MELCENRGAGRRQNHKTEMENANKKTQQTGPTAARDRCYTLAVVCVFLLCFVLLIATTVLWIKYSILTTEKEELQTRHNALILERDQLHSHYESLWISYGEITLERDCLKERIENLTINREKLQNTTAELQRKLNFTETQENQKWKHFGSSLYYIPELKSWHDSKEDCKKKGGHLVIINNEAEELFINNELGQSQAWIGLSDIETENTWKWVDETQLATGFWREHEPNGNREENCVELYNPIGQSSWNDRHCSKKSSWICEKKLN